MSETLMISACSPTMAGLKTGSLFSCTFESRDELLKSIRRFNRIFSSRGVRLLPLRIGERRALIYMYRPDRLRRDLKDDLAGRLLSERAYPSASPGQCVAELRRRLDRNKDFPHEIGLFLGYPAEDVDGFIRCGARAAKRSGAWKVYGDEEEAAKKFALYRKCTDAYKRAYQRNGAFDKLVVSVKNN